MPAQERTKLLVTLGAIETALVIALLVWRNAPIAPWWVIAVVMAIWLASAVALRTHQRTWGKEGRVLDWWSVPHFLGGVLFGLSGIGVTWVIAAAAAWEGIEMVSAVEEYPANRAADIVLALTGWIAANLVAGGPFPLT
jgi:hypothetical protein